jgi:hypothetical protein
MFNSQIIEQQVVPGYIIVQTTISKFELLQTDTGCIISMRKRIEILRHQMNLSPQISWAVGK